MTLKLPRLPNTQADPGQMQIWWQQVVEAIEGHEAAQEVILIDLASQLTAINAVRKTDAISASWTVPTNIISAADAGANVTLTIANHTRYYGDGTSVAVTGGPLTGQAYNATVAVYYDDSTRALTTPTFHATTDLKTAQSNYAPGRHLVGTVKTPASGGASTSGGTSPPGSGYTPGGTTGYSIP